MLELTDNRNELNIFFEQEKDEDQLIRSSMTSIKILKLSQ
jgi:hypothetical protein